MLSLAFMGLFGLVGIGWGLFGLVRVWFACSLWLACGARGRRVLLGWCVGCAWVLPGARIVRPFEPYPFLDTGEEQRGAVQRPSRAASATISSTAVRTA